MGNTAVKRACRYVRIRLDDCSDDESSRRIQKVVTVLRWDGTTMEFSRELKVSKLLKDFPGHSVCKADELGSVGRAKMLSPKTLLELGKTYLVLPRTQQQQQKQKRKAGARPRKVSSLLSSRRPDPKPQEKEKGEEEEEEERAPQTIKILITRQQLAKMIADGSLLLAGRREAVDLTDTSAELKDPGLWHSSMRLFNHPQSVESNGADSQRNWSPELDSIVEVPGQ